MKDYKDNLSDSKPEIYEKKVSPGDWVVLTTYEGDTFYGTLMPGYESMEKKHVVIKLKSGYNIGVRGSRIKSISKAEYDGGQTRNISESSKMRTGSELKTADPLPKVALIGTGGTIASKIDYRTGGVSAALSASELYNAVPELKKYASIDADFMFNEYSENLEPHHWTQIANKIAEKVRSGVYHGIVVSHGTDTMHYTAAALSFALHNLPIPVVLVGSQRSSDRPSSDGALNLIGATIFSLKSPFSGVFVAMHGSTSDDVIVCHLGTRVRKNHTSRRDAFESIDRLPIGTVRNDVVQIQSQDAKTEIPKRTNTNGGALNDDKLENHFTVKPRFDPRVTLLKYYPGLNPNLIAYCLEIGYKAIVIEGTGLGHIGRKCFPAIDKAIKSGIMVFMTSQCIWGRTNMRVYDTGRDLIKMGVVPLADMIPETALVKAMWVVANSSNNIEAARMMERNIANEISLISPISGRALKYDKDSQV
jgi:glutamyl-tRNA(Gln) amidotransferase subunit D